MTGLSDFFKVIQQEKENQDKELYSLLGEEFSTDSFIDSLFSSAKEEIKKEKVIEEKITKIFDEIISDKNEVIVEEEQEEQIIEEEIEEEEIVQEYSKDKSINQYIDFLKETVKNKPQEYQKSLTNPSSKEIQELKNLVWQVMRDVRAQGGGGEVNLRYLDDIVGIATNSSSYNGKYLQWNSTTNTAEFTDPSDAETITIVSVIGITTYYQATNTDDYIGVNANVPVTIQLPTSPITGKKITVKDEGNKIATYNITVQAGAGTSVENDTSVVMKINHQSLTYFYNNSNWFLI